MTFAYWTVSPSAVLPLYDHPHEQGANAIEGEFEMTIGGETQVLKPGVLAIIAANVAHTGRALSFCRIIDVFHPCREDYR